MPNMDSGTLWTIVGNIISFISLVVAVIFFILGRKKTILQYKKSTTPLITEKMAGILNDRMSIDGQPIKNLASTTISFINSGNQRIQSSEFSDQEPLRVILTGHLYAHDVSLGNQKLLPKVEPVNDKALNISFENLKPGQFFRVTILHDGTLDVLGELTTGTMREFSSRFNKIAPSIASFAMIAVMFASILIFDKLYDSHIMETMLVSYWGFIILVLIPLVSVLLIFAVVLTYEEPFLRDDDTNESIKKDHSLLKIIDRIFRE